jgi:hypothetical protein
MPRVFVPPDPPPLPLLCCYRRRSVVLVPDLALPSHLIHRRASFEEREERGREGRRRAKGREEHRRA